MNVHNQWRKTDRREDILLLAFAIIIPLVALPSLIGM